MCIPCDLTIAENHQNVPIAGAQDKVAEFPNDTETFTTWCLENMIVMIGDHFHIGMA